MGQFLSIILCGCLFLSSFLTAPVVLAFTGPVIGIVDGDTVDVLHNGQAERIRLNGIDCPERGQAYGKKAKQFTADLIFGKEVRVSPIRKDRHGRTVADVVLSDGIDVAHELVKSGYAWWFKKYAPHDETLAALEGEARAEKRGLWADSHPVPPWDIRHPPSKKPMQAAPFAGTQVMKPDSTAIQIIGNRQSKIYQRPDCPNYTATSPKNRVMFNSAKEAEQAGYRVAKTCF
jgi:endonuclease YncB( thermonuclease family)